MEELDLLGGLSDIEEQLRAGNANHGEMCAALLQIAQALAAQKAPTVTVTAPDVNFTAPAVSVPVSVSPAPVTVLQAPAASYDWEHTHQYDELGRLVKTISKRVTRKEK